MSQPDIACKEWFFRQKDSSVKGGTIQGPLIGLKQEVEADATIQKPIETESKDFGAIAYSWGCAPKLSNIDPYLSAQRSFIDMVGKIIAIGGALPDMKNAKWDAWAVCGNYCQPNSEANETLTRESGEHNLASLLREVIGVREVVEALNIPVISGKDSMKCSGVYDVPDDFTLDMVPADLRKHIILGEVDRKVTKKNFFGIKKTITVKQKMVEIHDPDSYIASSAVKIEDYRKCVSSSLKEEGDRIYVVGTTKDHLGASQFLSAIGYQEQGAPIESGLGPRADLEEFICAANAIHSAIDNRLVASCSYIHNGGIAAALAKACWAGEKGADIVLKYIVQDGSCKSNDDLMYSETPGRFIVTISAKDKEKFEAVMNTTTCKQIGMVTSEQQMVLNRLDGKYEQIDLGQIKQAWKKPHDFNRCEAVR
jgi:phosphoribosylformylglycinamidine synthase